MHIIMHTTTIKPTITRAEPVPLIKLNFGDNLSVEIGHGFNRAFNTANPENYNNCHGKRQPFFLFSCEVQGIFQLTQPHFFEEFEKAAYDFFHEYPPFVGIPLDAQPEPEDERSVRLSTAALKPFLNHISLLSDSPIISQSIKLQILEQVFRYSLHVHQVNVRQALDNFFKASK